MVHALTLINPATLPTIQLSHALNVVLKMIERDMHSRREFCKGRLKHKALASPPSVERTFTKPALFEELPVDVKHSGNFSPVARCIKKGGLYPPAFIVFPSFSGGGLLQSASATSIAFSNLLAASHSSRLA